MAMTRAICRSLARTQGRKQRPERLDFGRFHAAPAQAKRGEGNPTPPPQRLPGERTQAPPMKRRQCVLQPNGKPRRGRAPPHQIAPPRRQRATDFKTAEGSAHANGARREAAAATWRRGIMPKVGSGSEVLSLRIESPEPRLGPAHCQQSPGENRRRKAKLAISLWHHDRKAGRSTLQGGLGRRANTAMLKQSIRDLPAGKDLWRMASDRTLATLGDGTIAVSAATGEAWPTWAAMGGPPPGGSEI